jgi:hypothetical protein
MRLSATARRYSVHVTVVPRGDRWGVCLELTSDTGAILNRAHVADLVFDAVADAEAAGWRLADEWISRLTGPPVADDAPLEPEERGMLMGCDHPVARCRGCGLHHRLFELQADRHCARCRADLTAEVRRHVRECRQILIRRAAAATDASRAALKENRRVREAGGVARAEAEAIRAEAKRTRARRVETFGSMCRLCDRPVIPGQPVSFRHGVLVHLACYERRASGA